jgi:hypothetical protein
MTIRQYDIPSIVNTHFHLTPFPSNSKAGFQVSGIYPFSGDIFQNEEFMEV